MKRIALLITLLFAMGIAKSQTTYYWVGGTGPATISGSSNWNTQLDGSGTSRSSAQSNDILVFDGSNIGGSAAATGAVTVTITSQTIGQLHLTNNANVTFSRPSGAGGSGTVTVAGVVGDDVIIDAGSSFFINSSSGDGNVIFVFGSGSTGVVYGNWTIQNTSQSRIANGTGGAAGSLVFKSGSTFHCNITSSSASYPFGSASQSSALWVVFESGASLYYEGGWSPMGNQQAFAAVDFRPGSTWHHRASNPIPSTFGSFFNTKGFGNIIVENGATLGCDGPVYRIGNLTINSGCGFTTHSSGQTAVLGDLTVNGSYSAPSGSSNVLVLGGNTQQTVSGSGTIVVPNLVVADNADVVLNQDITVGSSTYVFGKINFTTHQVNGAGTFGSKAGSSASDASGTLVAGSYQITGLPNTISGLNGLTVSGTGIAPNTNVVGFSGSNGVIALSQPLVGSGSGVALTFTSNAATLATSNPNGMDSLTGSVTAVGDKNFSGGTNYIINAATSWPFGISSGTTDAFISIGSAEINAPITLNTSLLVSSHFTVNSKVVLRPLDVLRILTGGVIDGNYNSSNYINTGYNNTTGDQSYVEVDNVAAAVTLPIGTDNSYLPAVITPTATSVFTASVFEGITTEGTLTGTAFTSVQKQSVVDAVWNIQRISGSGDANLQLQWPATLEGSTFTTLADSEIGIITNDGTSWSLPVATGDNTANMASATVSTFGNFAIGSQPPTQPFIFNALPGKTYGDPDFNGGAISLNTTKPITYSSNNTAVATIVGGDIHIVGAGTADITASQASDGFYPAASATQTLTVDKAALTIKADDKTKFEGAANPALTATYTGFVYSETPAVFTTALTLATTATTGSTPGTYPITASGAVAANYTITFVNGTMTVLAKQTQTITFNTLPTKNYGNADFAAGATSTNSSLPITYSSSNTSVATVSGGIIHITGAGTTTITASQAGDFGHFPAADVSRTLTVNKVALAIKVRDTTKVEGQANPPFTITYSGFVLGENASNLLTPATATTTATTGSAAGYYPITLGGATSNNYTITYTNARLTVYPVSGTDQQYLNAFMSNSTTLTVRVYSSQPALGDIMVWDFSGRPLLKKNLFMPTGFISVDLAVPTLPSGIYIVTVKGPGVNLKKTVPIVK